MISDNGYLIYLALKNKKANFVREVFQGNAYYFAKNRAAKRFLRSNGVKKLGLEIDFELMAIA
jgi:hypothetical protein